MTPVDFGVASALGLVSGLHCLQMCGPIALVVGAGAAAALLYNAGRIVTYTFLGAVAGLGGPTALMLARAATATAIFAGAAMIVAGLLMIGLLPRRA